MIARCRPTTASEDDGAWHDSDGSSPPPGEVTCPGPPIEFSDSPDRLVRMVSEDRGPAATLVSQKDSSNAEAAGYQWLEKLSPNGTLPASPQSRAESVKQTLPRHKSVRSRLQDGPTAYPAPREASRCPRLQRSRHRPTPRSQLRKHVQHRMKVLATRTCGAGSRRRGRHQDRNRAGCAAYNAPVRKRRLTHKHWHLWLPQRQRRRPWRR